MSSSFDTLYGFRIDAIIKPPNRFSTSAVTTYLGSIIVMYAPTMDMETVDIAEAHSVYRRCSGNKPICFLTEINTSDCPKIAEATALYDSSLPMPFTLLSASPIYLIINGKIFRYCKMPISAEITTIGIRTIRKNCDPVPSFTSPPNTKLTPSAA
ncbi:hypothetical protein D3C77_512770 [compost metagenome]